jgi:DnaJ-class molecular chaperone
MTKKEKFYSFDDYMRTFSPHVCRTCEGSGVTGSLPRGTLRHCPDCDGTGRKDRRTLEQVVGDVMRKVRRA